MENNSITRLIWLYMLNNGGPIYPLSYDNYRKYEYDHRRNSKVKQTDYPMAEFGANYQNEPTRDSYWSYYGSGPNFCEDFAEKFLNDDIQIDWNLTKEPTETTESSFEGTFADSSEIPVLIGTLVPKNGNKYPWICQSKFDMSGLNVLLTLIKSFETQSEEEVIAKLKTKIKKALKRSASFKYELLAEDYS